MVTKTKAIPFKVPKPVRVVLNAAWRADAKSLLGLADVEFEEFLPSFLQGLSVHTRRVQVEMSKRLPAHEIPSLRLVLKAANDLRSKIDVYEPWLFGTVRVTDNVVDDNGEIVDLRKPLETIISLLKCRIGAYDDGHAVLRVARHAARQKSKEQRERERRETDTCNKLHPGKAQLVHEGWHVLDSAGGSRKWRVRRATEHLREWIGKQYMGFAENRTTARQNRFVEHVMREHRRALRQVGD